MLVGDIIQGDKLLYSTTAYQRLYDLLYNTLKTEKVFIEVINIPKPVEVIPVIPKPVELPIVLPEVVITEKIKQDSVTTNVPSIRYKEINLVRKTHNYNKTMDNKTLVQN